MRYLALVPWILGIALTVGQAAYGQVPPPPVVDCSVELDRIRGYAVILKGDRDQKEAALAEYGAQIRTLQAEIARLKEPHKETK